MSDQLTHCPECGVELAPRDERGFPYRLPHEAGCTALARLRAEIERRPFVPQKDES